MLAAELHRRDTNELIAYQNAPVELCAPTLDQSSYCDALSFTRRFLLKYDAERFLQANHIGFAGDCYGRIASACTDKSAESDRVAVQRLHECEEEHKQGQHFDARETT